MRRLAIGMLFSLLMAGCASKPLAAEPLATELDCDVEVTNAYGTFLAQGHGLKWWTHLPDDIYVELEYFVWLDPKENEKLRPFGGPADLLEFYVGWYGPGWKKIAPRVGEATSGAVSIRTDYPFQASGSFRREDARRLLAEKQDIVLRLTDTAGVALRQMEIPREFLDAVESELRKVEKAFRENVQDKEVRCPRRPLEKVIIA